MRAGSPRPQDVIALARAEAAWIDQQGLLPVHSEQLLNVEPSNPPALNNGAYSSASAGCETGALQANEHQTNGRCKRQLWHGVQQCETICCADCSKGCKK